MFDLKLDGESLDLFMDGKLAVLQKVKGYRFSIDSILLAGFSSLKRKDSAVELGAGSGIVSMLLAVRDKPERIVGIDIQESMVDMARRSIRMNGLDGCIEYFCMDIRKVKEIFGPASFHAALFNPPYRKVNSGRVNPNREKATARHEMNGAIADFMKASAYLVKEKGRVFAIFPARRAVTLITSMRQYGIEPKRICLVHSDRQSRAEFILAEGLKGGGEELSIEPPLAIYDTNGSYSDDMKRIFEKVSFFKTADGV